MSSPGRPADDLRRQVAAADQAVQQQEMARRIGERPRLKGVTAMLVALAGLALSVWIARTHLGPQPLDPATLREGQVAIIRLVGESVESYAVAHGALPASLAEVGFDGLGYVYTRAPGGFRLAIAGPTGDSITWEPSPAPAGGAR